MTGKWLFWVRRAHLVLGVFFSPLLLLFILTGWWQTVATDDEKEAAGGRLHTLLQHLSSVHTDDYFPPERPRHSHHGFKVLVVTMCLGLIATILLGLFLALKMMRRPWLVLATFLLGILVPAVLLWLG
jgi:hypothetical protein